MKFLTPEEQRLADLKRAKLDRRLEAWWRFTSAMGSLFRITFFTPLSIVFKVIHFGLRVLGYVASIGILVGLYYVYCCITELRAGAAFFEIEAWKTALKFIVAPFVFYALSAITEWLYEYFEDHAF